MKQKKCMLCLLILCLMIGQLTGCQKTKQSPKDEVAMGRYFEEDVEMPEAVESGEEVAYYLVVNPEDKFEVYAANKKDLTQRRYIRKEDGTWEQSVPDWMSKFQGEGLIAGVNYDPAGNCFAFQTTRAEDGDSTVVNIYKSTDGKTAEKVYVEDYEDPITSYEMPLQMEAISTEKLVILNYKTINIYNNGKNRASIDTQGHGFTYCNDKLIVTDGSKDCIDFIDMSDGTIENQIEFNNLRSLDAKYTSDSDGNIYMVTRDGVYRTTEKGTTVEEIMDAKLTSLNQPSLDIEKIIVINQNDFYILYCGEAGKRLLKHYSYDENLPTVPDKKLTIVSLYECASIRQGIYAYENSHPDVWVDYQVLVEDEDGVQKNDAINKLNTELLAGAGPDLIVLDGLSMNSYIEKGVLDDLTSALKPYLNENKLLPNVVKNATKDSKIYAMPLRIEVPYAYGVKEAVQSIDTIESLAQYASTQKLPIFSSYAIPNQLLAQIMYDYYSYEFIQEDNLDENKLNDFLGNLKIIADQTETRPNTEEPFFDTEDESILSAIFSETIYQKESQLGMITLRDMIYSFEPIFVTDHVKGSTSTIHDQYRPSGLLGVNAKSKQPELAAEFITTMFSKDVQKMYLEEGFPINTDALNGYEMQEDDYCFCNDMYDAGQPKDMTKLQKILDLCTTLDTPMNMDHAMKDMVVDGAARFLNDELSQKEAVEEIVNKVNIYLQE